MFDRITCMDDVIEMIMTSDLPESIQDACAEYLEQQDRAIAKAHQLIDKLAEALP